MHRFFISSPDKVLENEVLIVSEDLVHQIKNVLRFEVGDKVIFFDGSGLDFVVEFSEISKKQVLGKVLEKRKNDTEPSVKISLYLAILKHQERFEIALQKGTEVGVFEFIPLVTERTEKPVLHKLDRLKRIIKEASEQSGRGFVPEIKESVKFSKIIKELPKDKINLVAQPGTEKNLKEILSEIKNVREINLFIGPEGGFSENEISVFMKNGGVVFNAGKRIFRTETAAIVIPAIILELT